MGQHIRMDIQMAEVQNTDTNYNIIEDEALKQILKKSKDGLDTKVDKETGKGLSKNDFTDAYKKKVDDTAKQASDLVAAGGQPNTIETVKVNGTAVTPDSKKAVDIKVPTTAEIKTQIENYGYQNADAVENAITGKGYQTKDQVNTIVTGKGYQTASQVDNIVTGKGYQTETQVANAIKTAIGGVTQFKLETPSDGKLPTTGAIGVIYRIPSATTEDKDLYDEYYWDGSKYEFMGHNRMDLSPYAKKENFTVITAAKIDELWDSL